MIKVSLILTTFNSKDNLKKTLESIEYQDYPYVEVVIKDGGSTDGTLDVIKQYKEYSRYAVGYESKPDTGIYDAMNQGYTMCSGDVIVFFNDVFVEPSVISKMVALIENNRQCVGAHADLVYKDDKRVVRKWHMGEGDIYHGWMPGHPTYGLYRTDFKISADYEFMIRFLKEGENKLAYLPETIIAMFYGGTSSGGIRNYLLSLKEGHRALKLNGIKRVYYIDFRRILRVLMQFIS